MKQFRNLFIITGVAMALVSCKSKFIYLDTFAPEESSLNIVKITQEENSTVLAGASDRTYYSGSQYATKTLGVSKYIEWGVHNLLEVSPDGKQIAYCTRMNKQDNVMIRKTGSVGAATQRTFRNVHSFSWGKDNKLYFSDANGQNNYICRVNAESGSMMDQLTSGSVNDLNPVVSDDGKTIFFTRTSTSGPSIWSLDTSNGTLTSCSRGYSPCLIKDNPNAFYCVRNTSDYQSEIWYIDFVKGKETVILSSKETSFTHPRLSPDGKWLLVVGNSLSNISNKHNLDIFVVRTDGTRLTQLTYHPDNDTSPAWAADGRSIYFISPRANKEKMNNIWRMNFTLE